MKLFITTDATKQRLKKARREMRHALTKGEVLLVVKHPGKKSPKNQEAAVDFLCKLCAMTGGRPEGAWQFMGKTVAAMVLRST